MAIKKETLDNIVKGVMIPASFALILNTSPSPLLSSSKENYNPQKRRGMLARMIGNAVDKIKGENAYAADKLAPYLFDMDAKQLIPYIRYLKNKLAPARKQRISLYHMLNDVPEWPLPHNFNKPVMITSGFKFRMLRGVPEFNHNGIDIDVAYGTVVKAIADGKVLYSGYDRKAGHYVKIEHGNNLVSKYLHLSTRNVKTGKKVSKGRIIGRAGSSGNSTGPHLHFELRVDDQPIDPRDVVEYGYILFEYKYKKR